MSKNAYRILGIFVLVLLLVSCMKNNETPNNPTSFTWDNFDYSLFITYLEDNEQDFVEVYNILREKASRVQLGYEYGGDNIVWLGKGKIKNYFDDREILAIDKVFKKHELTTITVFENQARFQSPHVENGYYFFTYYKSLEPDQEHYAYLMPNWGFSSMGD